MWMYGVWLALACSASCATHSAQMEMYKYMVMCMSGGVRIVRARRARAVACPCGAVCGAVGSCARRPLQPGGCACGDRVSLSALC